MPQLVLPLSKRVLRTQFVKAALSERLCDVSGEPWAAYYGYYQSFCADERVGMVITGHIAVSAEGRAESFYACLEGGERNLERAVAGAAGEVELKNLHKDDIKNLLKDSLYHSVSDAQRAASLVPPVFIAQISHAGPQAPLYLRPQRVLGFSAVRGGLCFFKRKDLKIPSDRTAQQFVNAALTCERCGFDGIELHAGHGYLLCGCCEMGYLSYIIDIIDKIRSAIAHPGFVIGIKVNAGPHLFYLLKLLRGRADFVEVTQGSYSDPMALVDNYALKPALRAAYRLKRQIAEFQGAETALRGTSELKSAAAGEAQFSSEDSRKAYFETGGFASSADQQSEAENAQPWPLIVATGGFRTIYEGQSAVDAGQCDLAGFGRLFCLPGQESVTRLEMRGIQGWIVRTIGKMLPLVNAGPQTVWYQENMRRWARDATQKPELRYPRILLLWWTATLLGWVAGAVRFAARCSWE